MSNNPHCDLPDSYVPAMIVHRDEMQAVADMSVAIGRSSLGDPDTAARLSRSARVASVGLLTPTSDPTGDAARMVRWYRMMLCKSWSRRLLE